MVADTAAPGTRQTTTPPRASGSSHGDAVEDRDEPRALGQDDRCEEIEIRQVSGGDAGRPPALPACPPAPTSPPSASTDRTSKNRRACSPVRTQPEALWCVSSRCVRASRVGRRHLDGFTRRSHVRVVGRVLVRRHRRQRRFRARSATVLSIRQPEPDAARPVTGGAITHRHEPWWAVLAGGSHKRSVWAAPLPMNRTSSGHGHRQGSDQRRTRRAERHLMAARRTPEQP